MLQYPNIDPIIFSIGPLAIRWYGMMYLLGFLAAFWLGRRQAKKPHSPLAVEQVEDFIFYGALGAVLGGRVGYVFFYGFDRFLEDPLWLLRVWEGGMSFHGGLLGVMLAFALYARRVNRPIGALANFVAPLAPIGLGLGRLANFINGELYGRETDVPWAMVFPQDYLQLTRHPSQLYQAFLEGVVLFVIVYWYARKPRPLWSVAAVFVFVYGCARYIVEYFREPDASLVFEWMTRGQMLSIPMVAGGIILFFWAVRTQQPFPLVESKADSALVVNARPSKSPRSSKTKKKRATRKRK